MRQASQRDRELQRYAREFLEGKTEKRIDVDELVGQIFESDKWKPDRKRMMRMLREDLSHALSEERFTDEDMRRVRKYHFVKAKKNDKQLTLCFPIESISTKDMKMSLQVRRNDLVARAVQINNDQNHFNQYYNNGEAIQTSFDFTNDIREAEAERLGAMEDVSSVERSRPSSRSRVSLQESISVNGNAPA